MVSANITLNTWAFYSFPDHISFYKCFNLVELTGCHNSKWSLLSVHCTILFPVLITFASAVPSACCYSIYWWAALGTWTLSVGLTQKLLLSTRMCRSQGVLLSSPSGLSVCFWKASCGRVLFCRGGFFLQSVSRWFLPSSAFAQCEIASRAPCPRLTHAVARTEMTALGAGDRGVGYKNSRHS